MKKSTKIGITLTLAGLIGLSTGLKLSWDANKKISRLEDSTPSRLYEVNQEISNLEQNTLYQIHQKGNLNRVLSDYDSLIKERENIYKSNPELKTINNKINRITNKQLDPALITYFGSIIPFAIGCTIFYHKYKKRKK